MPLPRLQLFELEDLPLFPNTIRDLATDYIHFLETRFALHQSVVPLLRDALKESNTARVVDLCSGGGGPVLGLHQAFAAAGEFIHFTLTDKYPNVSAFRLLSSRYPASISYRDDSVNAAAVPRDLVGFRTVFNAFHHFAPATGRAVLENAVASRQPVGIFEIPERAMASIIPLLLTPLFIAIATPFIRPFQWRRLLWTYLIPLVPLTSLWDGIVSQWRAYTVAELLDLTRGLNGYTWNAGRVPIGTTPGHLTYLLGIPVIAPESDR
jgi:hypothetical protein